MTVGILTGLAGGRATRVASGLKPGRRACRELTPPGPGGSEWDVGTETASEGPPGPSPYEHAAGDTGPLGPATPARRGCAAPLMAAPAETPAPLCTRFRAENSDFLSQLCCSVHG